MIFSHIKLFRADCLFESLRTRNNLQNFLGDGGLTGTVIFQRQLSGEFSGVITSGLHRCHTSSKFGGNRFLEGSEDLSVEVKRKDGVDDLDRVLFEDHIVREFLGFGNFELGALDTEISGFGSQLENFVTLLGDVRGRERNKCSDGRSGGDKGDELGVKQFNSIGFSTKESVQQFLGDGKGVLGVGVLSAREGLSDREVSAFEVGDSLNSDKDHVNINSLLLEFIVSSFGLLDHEGVVSSAKTTVTGDNGKSDLLDLTLGQKRKIKSFTSQSADQSSEDRLKGLGERTGGDDSVLSTSDLSGSDKLHGHGDLLGVLDRNDTVTDGCEVK